jgi:hypothetical protein
MEIKNLLSFKNQILDCDNVQTYATLYTMSKLIDSKYLSPINKDRLNQLIEDIYVHSYIGVCDGSNNRIENELCYSKSIQNSLLLIKNISKGVVEEDMVPLEQDMIDKLQDFIYNVLFEQTNKMETERLNYKLFV